MSDYKDVCCWIHASAEHQRSFMIVCTNCGNKRCPKSTLCSNECTKSNDVGQDGSRYGGQ